MGMYQGVNASEGIGIGTVMVAVDPDLTFEPHEVADRLDLRERAGDGFGGGLGGDGQGRLGHSSRIQNCRGFFVS